MDLQNKKTALDDTAALYKHETDSLTEKEKLKDMSFSKKLQYFKQYYLLKVVLALVGVGVLVSILVSVFKPQKEAVLYVAIYNSAIESKRLEVLKEDFENSLNLDKEKYEVTFDQSFSYGGLYSDDTNRFAMMAKIGTITVALLPKSVYEVYAKVQYFERMEDFLTEEEMEIFKERLAFVAIPDEDGKETEGSSVPYGLMLEGCSYITENSSAEPVILTVIAGHKDNNYAKEFLKFLFANE